jgi:hypothetical protein
MKWWWVLIVVLLFPGSVETSEGAMRVRAIGTWELIALHIPADQALGLPRWK